MSDGAERSETSQQLQEAINHAWRLISTPGGGDASPLAELSALQMRCLTSIAENPGGKVADIASAMGMSVSSVSRTIERLVRQELARRVVDDQDRRIVRVYLTESASNSLQSAESERLARIQSCLAELPPAVVDQLISSLNQLTAAAKRSSPET